MYQVKADVLPPWVSRRAITVDDYARMAEAGILTRDDRVELIEGQIIEMPPIGSEHAGRVNRLNRTLVLALGERGILTVQNPVRLNRISEPQPDFAVLKPRADDYTGSHPQAADVLLLIEVADSSLAYDQGVKAGLYARNGVPEFWLVDVRDRSVTMYREPEDGSYKTIVPCRGCDVLTIAALPGLSLRVEDVFPTS